ncbi:hypothetical protein Tco_1244254 [Tanacetum coccineum]
MATLSTGDDNKLAISTILIFTGKWSETVTGISRLGRVHPELKIHPPRDFEIEFRINSVGTVLASLVTYASIQALKPDLFINALHLLTRICSKGNAFGSDRQRLPDVTSASMELEEQRLPDVTSFGRPHHA